MSCKCLLVFGRPNCGGLGYRIWMWRHDVSNFQRNFHRTFGGFGPPSKVADSYRLHRVNKAVEEMSETDHQDDESADGKAGSLLKQNRFGDRGQLTGTIERLVEDMIHQSVEHGDFEDLPGRGKPIPPKPVSPYIDIHQYNLNRVLKNNGAAPEFVTLEREAKEDLAECKSRLFRERLKLGPEPLNDFNRKKLAGLVSEFSDEVKGVNKIIVNFNLSVPSLRLQKALLRPERELEKVLDRYKEHAKSMKVSEDATRIEEPKITNQNIKKSTLSQFTERFFNRILRQTD